MSDQETLRRMRLFKDYQGSPEYQEKLLNRLKYNDAANNSLEAKAMLFRLCTREDNPAEGCIFFIENFGFTFDPRPQADPNHLPFFLFDYQKDAIRFLIEHIDQGRDGLFEKSRDMGASWLIFVYVPLWYWLFRDGTNVLMGSYKEALVDNRSKDSLMGMLDYALQNLPLWMYPKGFNHDKHRNHMKLINPVNFNQISGDTMNPNFGRGSRKTVVLFDELGFWDYAKDAWESASDVTACKIANSTPCGHNFYAQLRNSGIDVFTMHWKMHPLKDDIWYEYEKGRRTEEEVAQELDISYEKSQEGRVYPEWNSATVELGLFEYDPDLPLFVSWDFGRQDSTALIWSQKTRENKLRIIDTYAKSGKHIEFFVPLITGFIGMDLVEKYQYTKEELEMVERHRGWKKATHFGDPSGRFITQASDYSVMDILKTNGVVVNFRDEWKTFAKRKHAAKLLIMSGVEVNRTGHSEYFHSCMTQAAYPKTRRDGLLEVNSKEPLHNWTSHFRSSFEYLALGLEENNQHRRQPSDKFKSKKFNRKRVIGY